MLRWVATGGPLQRSALRSVLLRTLVNTAPRMSANLPYPRAAVATTVMRQPEDGGPREYLLAQRSKPPRTGSWSLPGGKIELNETTLSAAARELEEETGLGPSSVRFHPWPIGASDVITTDPASGQLAFHYVITQCFAWANADAKPVCGDDASAVRWATRAEVDSGVLDLGGNVGAILQRAEELMDCGGLSTVDAICVSADGSRLPDKAEGHVER